MDRLEQLRRNIDKTSMSIIEIGPFFSPIAPRADGWDTTIVDFQDGDALREMARGHTAEVIRNKVDEIENVDIVWTGQPLDEAALAVRSDGFDCLIASHVIEHTPDLIRFLQQCSRLLKPDGIISLAVPDMRKCFDLLKSPTSLREILTAYREGRIRHSPEALFEGRCSAATRGGKSAWIKGDHSPLGYAHSLEAAWTEYQGDLKGDMSDSRPYVDNHAWFFTPAMFELAIFELNALKLVNFKIAFIEENIGSEFVVQLRRSDTHAALSNDALNAVRIKLALRHHAEFDAEVGPDYREIQPVKIEREIVKVPAARDTIPTRELVSLLATRIRRRVGLD
ncbi:methyltransferase domain-containing protein [Mesorhizobium sp. M0615]|uniref:class I SAM-dependent methyltransferase n=1 Tax=unclassified Mesorhizobium TaxID=325217 RepID=UPI0033377022